MAKGTESYRRFREEHDERGLEEIIRQYRDGLVFYLYSFVGSWHAAEELAEDTFVLLGTKRPRDKGRGSFKTWLYTIGRNLALNHLRRTARRCAAEEENTTESPEAAFLQAEEKITVHRAMQQLPPAYRQVLWLLYFEDFSCREAAAVMKKSVHNVETLAYRARRELRKQLEKEGFSHEKL